MFSAVPVPRIDWNERNMRYAMAAFPLIGAVIGALWCVCGRSRCRICSGRRALPDSCRGDGRDSSGRLRGHVGRAFKLRRPREKARYPQGSALRRVRGDSPVQPFHAVFCALRVRAVYAARRPDLLLALVLERCLSGYAVAAFPMAKEHRAGAHVRDGGGQAAREGAADDERLRRRGMACMGGRLLVLAALAALWRYRAVAVKQFGGVTGDLAGWFCSGRSFGCWRRCCFPGGGWDDLHYGAAVQRQADVRAEARRAADRRRAGSGGGAENLERLADELAAQYDVVMATEIGGGICAARGRTAAGAGGGRSSGLPAGRARGYGDRDVLRHCDGAQGEMPC